MELGGKQQFMRGHIMTSENAALETPTMHDPHSQDSN